MMAAAFNDPGIIWPDPEPLDGINCAEKPYPVDALPPIIADAVREYQGYGQQPLPLVAVSALSTMSLVTQGLADIARDDELSGPIGIYTLVIAQSGERKTSADKEFKKPIRAWIDDRRELAKADEASARAEVEAWKAEREGLLTKIKTASGGNGKKKTSVEAEADIRVLKEQLKNLEAHQPTELIIPTLFYVDTNSAALAVDLAEGWPSASLWSSEAGLVIGSQGMSDESVMQFLALLNCLWDAESYERRRRTTKSASLKGRRFTAAMMMQPIVLRQLLVAGKGASRGMGFVARCLVTWPTSTIGLRQYKAPTKGSPAMGAMHQRMTELLNMPLPTGGTDNMVLTPPVLRLSPEAFGIWRDFYNEIEAELGRWGEFSDIADIGAKIADNAARLAGEFHVFEKGPVGEVEALTMADSCRVAMWHLSEAKRVIGATELAPEVEDAKLLLEWMLKHQPGPFELRQISQFGPAQTRGKKRRDAALAVLIETKSVRELPPNSGKLHLNPKL
jgi:uncharacterized protein DUF3987